MSNKGKIYKVDKSSNKSKIYKMRFTEEEYYIMLYLADRYGMSLSRYIRVFISKAVWACKAELQEKGLTYEDVKSIFND